MIERMNPQGTSYHVWQNPDDRDTCVISKIGTNKKITVRATLEQISLAWYRWIMLGAYVQDAFSFLNADEREFLMTGITKEEWAELFPEE